MQKRTLDNSEIPNYLRQMKYIIKAKIELNKSTTEEFSVVQNDGNKIITCNINIYNSNMIIIKSMKKIELGQNCLCSTNLCGKRTNCFQRHNDRIKKY